MTTTGANIANVPVSRVSYLTCTDQIINWANKSAGCYVCFANVHMVMEAYDSLEFTRVINDADLVAPDGMPLVWMMRLKGERNQTRVYGPTLMLHVLETAAQKGIPVGFYGGKAEVLETLVRQMQARYEGLSVVFSFSPPFREVSAQEDEEIVRAINASGARILFVGLGCPKQEYWMAAHRGKVQAVMLGVGAAFDFHAGVKRQAPVLLQSLGLEWLFRLLTEPRRLWRRYLYHNPRFIVLAIADLLGLLKKI